MKIKLLLFLSILVCCNTVQAQKRKLSLQNADALIPVRVSVTPENYLGKSSVRATRLSDTVQNTISEAAFAKIKDIQFDNGTIEAEIAGMPLASAGSLARGFVGIAFRINEDNSKFECFYIRPTNGRANDQVRRNHSLQYISYPDYPWERSRKETPEKYESYADLIAGAWTKIKIEVNGDTAKLYVNDAKQPNLIVNDLKHGANSKGSIGLWVGQGTEAHFRKLVVTPK